MHVAMVLRQFSPFGGLELYTFELVKGLLDRGLRVTVICEKDDTNYRHEKLNVINFAAPPRGANKADKIRHYFQVASAAVAESGPYDLIHSQHFPIRQVDVVTFHNHTIFRLTEVGQRWEQLLNLIKVNTSQAYKLRDQHDRELCHQARCLIFPAKVCMDDFKRHYELENKHLAIAHPGASTEVPPAKVHSIEPGQTFNFLFVGKGYRKKGLDVLQQACKIVASHKKNFKLQIAGLKLKPQDRARLALAGLTKHVDYLGFQKDMNAVYQKSSCIILPSRIEPFGMAPIEGMLRGLIPVVSRTCGVAEVLSDEKDSLILEDHLKVQELAALMEKLIDNPDLCHRLSLAALETAQKLNWNQTVESTISAYNAVLSTSVSNR
ncbi:MAG: glycosyltransferase family 4 protein [Cyanobacteria bacterium SZAS LIN-5]|nr:glycosyltransferase family 4 protein [Cyanobacteria bacterium SZAS LIN-5]